MHRATHIGTALTILALAVTLVAAPVHAQDLAEPLLDRTGDKADHAQQDPQGFAEGQLTEEQIADDGNWTIAYGCFLAHEGADLADAEPPETDLCADYEDALGIDEEVEADAEEEVVADAQELQDDAVREAGAITEDAVETVAEVLEDPGNALDAVRGFVDRTISALGRIIDAVLGGLVSGPAAIGDAFLLMGQGVDTAMRAIGTTIGTAGTATADGITDAAADAWGGLTDGLSAVRDGVLGLFADDSPGATAEPAGDLVDADDVPTDAAADLLDAVAGSLAPQG